MRRQISRDRRGQYDCLNNTGQTSTGPSNETSFTAGNKSGVNGTSGEVRISPSGQDVGSTVTRDETVDYAPQDRLCLLKRSSS